MYYLLTTLRYWIFLIFVQPLAVLAALPAVHAPAIWHDNDDPRDVYTQEYLLALASTGQIKLVGTSTSTVVSPFNPFVSAAQAESFGVGRTEIQAKAEASGLSGFPPVTPQVLVGYLSTPASGQLEDTVALNSPVGNAIVAAAHLHGTQQKPLLVVCGGAMTAVADAYLIDPAVASKIMVCWLGGRLADLDEYNAGQDGWGNAVVLKNLPVTMFPVDIPTQEGSSPIVTKADLVNSLPPCPLRDLMVVKDHPENSLPGSIDADGLPAVFILNPAVIKSSVRKRFSGTTTINFGGQQHRIAVLSNDPNGNVVFATAVDQPLASRAWWHAFEGAFGKLEADPFRYYPLSDTQSGAQVAFATHEISPSYRGPLVTVRRGSDGTQADFYEGERQGSLNTLRGGGGMELTHWIQPNDEVRVMTWHDQSGKVRNAFATSPSTAPRIVEQGKLVRGSRNEPVLRFSIEDSLQIDDGQAFVDTAQLSVSIWGLVEPANVSSQAFLSKMALSSSTGLQTGWGIAVTSPDEYLVNIGGATTSPEARSPVGSVARSLWHHTATAFNGALSGNMSRLKLSLDSKTQALSFGGTIPDRIAAANSPLLIGKGGAGLNLDGQLGEVIIWTTQLDSVKTTQLHARRFVSEFSTPGEAVPFQDWAALAALEGDLASSEAVPHGDGLSNLIKYAFNLNGGGPDAKTLQPGAGDTAGLPTFSVVTDSNGLMVFRLEYLRRKNAGLSYVPEIASEIGEWETFDQEPLITAVNDKWERALIVTAAGTNDEPRRFVRLKVNLP